MKKFFRKNKPFANRSFLLFFLIVFFSFTAFQAKAGDSISIIPKPLMMHVHDGHFVLNNSTVVTTSASNADVKQTVEWFTGKMRWFESHGHQIPLGYKIRTDSLGNAESFCLCLIGRGSMPLSIKGDSSV